jgi:hypothetical protein
MAKVNMPTSGRGVACRDSWHDRYCRCCVGFGQRGLAEESFIHSRDCAAPWKCRDDGAPHHSQFLVSKQPAGAGNLHLGALRRFSKKIRQLGVPCATVLRGWRAISKQGNGGGESTVVLRMVRMMVDPGRAEHGRSEHGRAEHERWRFCCASRWWDGVGSDGQDWQ